MGNFCHLGGNTQHWFQNVLTFLLSLAYQKYTLVLFFYLCQLFERFLRWKVLFKDSEVGLQKRYLKNCGICYAACNWVPSGTYWNKDESPCYRPKIKLHGVKSIWYFCGILCCQWNAKFIIVIWGYIFASIFEVLYASYMLSC